jgi:hypothetical protein
MKSKIYPYTWHNPTKKELAEANIKSTFAFDLDSTLNEMGGASGLHEYLAKEMGVPPENVTARNSEGARQFDFNHPGLTDDEMRDLIQKYILEESPSLLPTPYMPKVLYYIYMAVGQPITVITYRPEVTTGVTYTWLSENLPDYVPFNLIMLHGMEKGVVLKRIGTNIYIDDRYKTVQVLEKIIDLSILYKRPWNQGRKVEAGDMTISDLRDLIPLVNFVTRQPMLRWPRNIPYPYDEDNGPHDLVPKLVFNYN